MEVSPEQIKEGSVHKYPSVPVFCLSSMPLLYNLNISMKIHQNHSAKYFRKEISMFSHINGVFISLLSLY